MLLLERRTMRIPDDDGSDCALPQYTLLFYSILFLLAKFQAEHTCAHVYFHSGVSTNSATPWPGTAASATRPAAVELSSRHTSRTAMRVPASDQLHALSVPRLRKQVRVRVKP